MANKIIETTHDYEPVNKYIDEKARIKRTRSVWGYTRSLALFLIALGIFLILAAYAYHIFKKPHPLQQDEIEQQQSENINKDIINKNKEIQGLEEEINQLESKIEENPENKLLKKQLEEKTKEAEQAQKQKEEIEKILEEQDKKIVDGEVIKYNKTTLTFESVERPNGYIVFTRRTYPTTIDLLEQKGNYKESCYIDKDGISFEFDKNATFQTKALNAMGLTVDQARSYEKFCKRTK